MQGCCWWSFISSLAGLVILDFHINAVIIVNLFVKNSYIECFLRIVLFVESSHHVDWLTIGIVHLIKCFCYVERFTWEVPFLESNCNINSFLLLVIFIRKSISNVDDLNSIFLIEEIYYIDLAFISFEEDILFWSGAKLTISTESDNCKSYYCQKVE